MTRPVKFPKLKFFLVLLPAMLGFLPLVKAAVTVQGITGASKVDYTTATKPIIYAGFAGTCASYDNISTCDSCIGALNACNMNNAYPALNLHIEVATGVTTLTASDLVFKIGSTESSAADLSVTAGVISADITWGELCGAVTSGNTSCLTAINSTISVGYSTSTGTTSSGEADFQVVTRYVDAAVPSTYTECPAGVGGASNMGYCYYQIRPGDEKVYVKDLGVGSDYPSTGTSGVEYSGLVFFYEPSTLASITAESGFFELDVDTEASPPTVDDERLMGLENDVNYCFIMANKDQTGIISAFAPGTVAAATACGTPAEVFGLLDDKKCFIATAAFGSEMAPEVQSFREFRNQYLLVNPVGKAVVDFYYSHSPKYAKLIASNDALRATVRAGLWPVLLFAKASLQFGLGPMLGIVLSLLGSISFILYRRRRRGVIS